MLIHPKNFQPDPSSGLGSALISEGEQLPLYK